MRVVCDMSSRNHRLVREGPSNSCVTVIKRRDLDILRELIVLNTFNWCKQNKDVRKSLNI